MKKRSIFSFILTCFMAMCLCVSAISVFNGKTVRAAQEKEVETSETSVIYDFDGTQVYGKYSNGEADVDRQNVDLIYRADNAVAGTFNGDGSTQMAFTGGEGVASDGWVRIEFAKRVKATEFPEMVLRFCAGNWEGETITKIYKLSDTEFSTKIEELQTAKGNTCASWTIDSAKLADEKGYVEGFLLKRDDTIEGHVGQYFFDYIKFIKKEVETSETSVIYDFDGKQVYGKYSNGENDKTHRNVELEYDADNRELANVFSGIGETQMAFTGGAGVAADGWVRIEFAKKVKAEDFPRMVLRICAGNWEGETITKIYKLSDTEYTTAVDELQTAFGNTCASWGIASAKLADENGYIEGFRLKREDTVAGNVGQFFFDYVKFLIEADVPKYEVSQAFIERDITEVMPVGEGFSIELKGKNDNEENIIAAVQTAAFDVLNANVKVTYTENYSFYFLMKANTVKDKSVDGGIMFWFTNNNITIGAEKGGSRNVASVNATNKPEVRFTSGSAVNVRCAAIPTYLEGVQAGYTLSVHIGNSEEAVISLYVDNKEIKAGKYTNIVTQDLGKDFTVEIKTAGAKAHSAEELMAVEITTSTGNTDYKKNKAIIKKNYFNVAGEVISEVKVEGDATYNENTGVLTFNKKGTVKLSYTVTNAFGTFKSNLLELTFDDGSTDKPAKKGCKSVVGGSIGAFAAIGLVAVCVIFKKKRDKTNN